MNDEQRRVHRVTVTALDLSRTPDPNDEIEKILTRIAEKYGEDSIREFIRMVLLQGKSAGESSTIIYGDAAVGQQLSIATRRIERAIETGE